MKYNTLIETNATTSTTSGNTTSGSCIVMDASSNGLSLSNSTLNMTNGGNSTAAVNSLFSEQVNTVTNLFEKWNNCERTVVMYALLKRLQYSSLKFLQYSIDNTLTQTMACSTNLSTVVIDMNANNPCYLLKLLKTYKTAHLLDGNAADPTTLHTRTTDKDSMPCYGSDFQLTANVMQRDEKRKKGEILYEVLNMLPLLKPGNEEAKYVYMTFIPLTVKDSLGQIVPIDVVQQIFSYMLIHPAVLNEDRRTLNDWLRHLEENMPDTAKSCPVLNLGIKTMTKPTTMRQQHNLSDSGGNLTTSGFASNATTATLPSSTGINSSNYNGSISSCSSLSSVSSRNSDWQTIAPPSKQQQHQQQTKNQTDNCWSTMVKTSSTNGGVADQFCDNFDGITLNELASSQNSLCLSIGPARLDLSDANASSLVSGVAAAAAATNSGTSLTSNSSNSSNLFGGGGNAVGNPIINIIGNGGTAPGASHNISGIVEDISDTSFSKNGTEILDFEPTTNESCSNSSNSVGQIQPQQQMGYAAMLMSNNSDHLSFNRLSLDSKLGALKTRRSNSLTTQTFLSSTSSSNSSVITVSDNYSNSTENLAQFANKPRSYSLSIEHHRNSLTNSGSDTRLDDFKPNYIKFQNPNAGMSSIGLWLKSLRLHKYLDLFKEMTYENTLQITEDYLINLGVTKGASHKLALCIEKLHDRGKNLLRMEQELLSGQIKLQAALDELANLVLTPMKAIDAVSLNADEENVALLFLRVFDMICSIAYKDPYALVDDDSLSVLLWIIDRMLHNEAFLSQINQLKEHKFKLSKVKMSVAPKMMHHPKNASNGSLNKSRWNGKSRKGDQKNGSNDRINYRKNSNDLLNFQLSGCLTQQQQQQPQPQTGDYDKQHHSAAHNVNNNQNNKNNINNNNNSNSSNILYKNSPFVNFEKHLQFQPPPPPMQQQRNSNVTNVAIPTQHPTTTTTSGLTTQQHRHSLNSLTMIAGGPQQAQKMIFKTTVAAVAGTGQGMLHVANTETTDDLHIEKGYKPQLQRRKTSLTSVNSNHVMFSSTLEQQQTQQQSDNNRINIGVTTTVSTDNIVKGIQTHQQQQQQQQNQSSLMVQLQAPSTPQILITCNGSHNNNNNSNNNNNNNNTTIINNNLLVKQQQQQQQQLLQHHQQQLQLLAAAAAAVGSACCNTNNNQTAGGNGAIMHCSICSNNIGTKTTSTLSSTSTSSSSPSTAAAAAVAAAPPPPSLLCDVANVKNTISNCLLPVIETPIPLTLTKTLHTTTTTITAAAATATNNTQSDINSLDQLETLCLQMTEQAIN